MIPEQNRKWFESMREEIQSECLRKLDALDILFPEFAGQGLNKKEAAAVKKARKEYKKTGGIPLTNHPENEAPASLCEMPDCGKKLRSDSKKCDPCGKRVCSKHWDRKAGTCKECVARL